MDWSYGYELQFCWILLQKSSSEVLYQIIIIFFIICLMVFNTTFNNISVISWRSVLLVEETEGNDRPAAVYEDEQLTYSNHRQC